MKLSTKGRYGLRAMIDLASHEEEGAVSIASISERQNISESYLEQLVRPLRKAGFIESVRGAGGGYVLAKPADSISVGDVLRVLEGGLEAVTCSVNEGLGGCDAADFCVTRFVPHTGRFQAVFSMLRHKSVTAIRCGSGLSHEVCVAPRFHA